MWKDSTVSPIFTSSPCISACGSHLVLGCRRKIGLESVLSWGFPVLFRGKKQTKWWPVRSCCHWWLFHSGFPGPQACSSAAPGQSTPLRGTGTEDTSQLEMSHNRLNIQMNYTDPWRTTEEKRGTLLTPISGIRIAWSISFSLQQKNSKEISEPLLWFTEGSVPHIVPTWDTTLVPQSRVFVSLVQQP